MSPSVLPAFGLKEESMRIEPFGSGLINHTWKIIAPDGNYILQRVNQEVFHKPSHIAHNIRLIADYLQEYYPEYKFIAPLLSSKGEDLVHMNGEGYFRLFPFVGGSHSKDVVKTPDQAYEAAKQFGRFTKLLAGMDTAKLKITIPSFHDLSLRYDQFLSAIEKGNSLRIHETEEQIKTLIGFSDIVREYEHIKSNPEFKLRVAHHDTKISNVLFDAEDRGLCVIDLDTVMPGYFISDVGDMMRTYLSPVSEEERDFEKIEVQDDFYKAIAQGYFNEMRDELTQTERSYFFYAGKFMIYMQALRFLTDHINDDVYYGAKYPGHNLIRAKNQIVLLERLMEKESVLATYQP
ncbi:aminoglycoside phosphotransferase family protein [Chitinophagaceae bacterium LB-8]|uniref:Aminoglycoside phosphotransferase family protein n=1 Tax=Paraflavisolibacter caeni TaxID=2982496 RepID=A0A9X2XNW2_9BACT|nr:aminoglycoside phosphotransferase family protein [Paraflavisolibacter caeni]MCU7549254.1 aminoglycoside phosphotransferase family protein [Paraflavisolibacter caeni]